MKMDPAEGRFAGEELVDAVAEVLAELKGEGDAPPAPQLFEEMAAYAWSGVVPGPDENTLEDRMHELCVAENLLAGDLMNSAGEDLVSADSRKLILGIITAATARKNIDDGEPVTIEQLAALGRVTERTVRGATSTTNPNPLPITKDGHWTYIQAGDALGWLSNRSDFRPTQTRLGAPSTAPLKGLQSVGALWRQWRQAAGLSVDALAERLGWNAAQASTYSALEQDRSSRESIELSPAFWRDLASSLGAVDPDGVADLTYQRILLDYARKRTQDELSPR